VAAQGWGGDRIELFRYKDGKMSLAWISSWDTPQDAQEFFRTIGACVNKRFPQMRLLTQKNEVLAWEDGNTQIYAEKKGQEVLILENIPRHLLEKIKAHSWQNVFP
jgi:hypothetical protein